MNRKNFITYLQKGLLTAFLAVVVTTGVAVYADTFTEPGQAAPNGNVSAPVNVGSAFQQKSGNFWAASMGTDNGYCIGASCITAWTQVTQTIGSCPAGQWATGVDTSTGKVSCSGAPVKIAANGASCNGGWCWDSLANAHRVCLQSGYPMAISASAGGQGGRVCYWSDTTDSWKCDGSCTTSCGSKTLTSVICAGPYDASIIPSGAAPTQTLPPNSGDPYAPASIRGTNGSLQ